MDPIFFGWCGRRIFGSDPKKTIWKFKSNFLNITCLFSLYSNISYKWLFWQQDWTEKITCGFLQLIGNTLEFTPNEYELWKKSAENIVKMPF